MLLAIVRKHYHALTKAIAAIGTKRSDRWPTVRKHHLANEGWCRSCGGVEHLEVHHICPFHIHPELELVESNFITLCEAPALECHLHKGHLGNWKNFNTLVREQCTAPKPNGLTQQ